MLSGAISDFGGAGGSATKGKEGGKDVARLDDGLSSFFSLYAFRMAEKKVTSRLEGFDAAISTELCEKVFLEAENDSLTSSSLSLSLLPPPTSPSLSGYVPPYATTAKPANGTDVATTTTRARATTTDTYL